MKTKNIFQQLGMTENEVRVYKALLSLGVSSITSIKKRTHMHRPSVYRALDSLNASNLVSHVPKGKRTLYSAQSPSLLKTRLVEHMEKLEEEIVPLERLYEKHPQKPSVTFHEGRSAVGQAYLEIPHRLEKGGVFYRYSSRDVKGRGGQINKRTLNQYRQERDKKQLERYVITSVASFKKKKPEMDRSIKVVPPDFDLFEHDISQVIYGNHILLIDYNSDTAIEIENPTMAHFQKKIFQLLFKLLPNHPR